VGTGPRFAVEHKAKQYYCPFECYCFIVLYVFRQGAFTIASGNSPVGHEAAGRKRELWLWATAIVVTLLLTRGWLLFSYPFRAV